MKKSNLIVIVILSIVLILSKHLNLNNWLLFVFILIPFLLVKYLFSVFSFHKKYSICPVCGNKTTKVKRTYILDPKKEKIYVLRMRFLTGNASKTYVVAHCPNCGWESDSKT